MAMTALMKAVCPSRSQSLRVARPRRRRKRLVGFIFSLFLLTVLGRVRGLVWRQEAGEINKEGALLGETGWGRLNNFSVLPSPNNKFSPVPTAPCIDETLKEKEKPKEEEREKPKDAPGLECKPRPLHKTCSLFMRNIAPNISRAEIISVSGGRGDTQALCGDDGDGTWRCF